MGRKWWGFNMVGQCVVDPGDSVSIKTCMEGTRMGVWFDVSEFGGGWVVVGSSQDTGASLTQREMIGVILGWGFGVGTWVGLVDVGVRNVGVCDDGLSRD